MPIHTQNFEWFTLMNSEFIIYGGNNDYLIVWVHDSGNVECYKNCITSEWKEKSRHGKIPAKFLATP
jgi:hypothetical protein